MCLNLLSLCLDCFQRGQFLPLVLFLLMFVSYLKKESNSYCQFLFALYCVWRSQVLLSTNFRYVQSKCIHMEVEREQEKIIQRPSLCLADGEQICGRTGTRMPVSFAALTLSSVLTYHEPKYILKCVLLSQLLLSESGKALGQPTWRFVSVSL